MRVFLYVYFVSLVAFCGVESAYAQTSRRWHVSVFSKGKKLDGSSWNRALPDLNKALSQAQSGDEIWVTQGIYTPDYTKFEDRRQASFVLPSGVAVYGGFIGHETRLSNRPPDTKSILSGDIGVRIKDKSDMADVGYDDNLYHVVRIEKASAGALLDGFIIEGGFAGSSFDIYNNMDSRGGGIYAEGEATLRNLEIAYNKSAYQGAGIYLVKGILTQSRIHHNQSGKEMNKVRGFGSGGGVYLYGGTLINSFVYFNTALQYGGGVHVDRGKLINTTLYHNEASIGGGVYVDHNALDAVVVANLIMHQNKAQHTIWGHDFYNEKVNGKGITLRCVLSKDGPRDILRGSETIRYAENTLYSGVPHFISTAPTHRFFLHLRADSPAIDKGDNQVLDYGGPYAGVDVVGRDRIQGKCVDLGAFEAATQ